MKYIEIDGVRYRVVEKRIMTNVYQDRKYTLSGKSVPTLDKIFEKTLVLEPIPPNAYKDEVKE